LGWKRSAGITADWTSVEISATVDECLARPVQPNPVSESANDSTLYSTFAVDRMTELNGISYTVRSISEMGIGLPGAVHHSEWVGETLFAAGRGRRQFVTCSQKTFFEAGDYALFDETSSIIVKPAQNTFAVPAVRRSVRRAAAGVTATVDDLHWAIDALDDPQLIAGIPTAHYRVTVTYSMTIDSLLRDDILGDELPRPMVRSTFDCWCARVNGLPVRAALPFSPSPMGGTDAARELSAMWATVMAQLALNGTLLKTRAELEVQSGAIENRTTSETVISDVRPSQIDDASFVLPREFVESGAEVNAGGSSPDDAVIKWRTPPDGLQPV
jgi:hypothetical protein